jgi:Putative zinc-finger
MSIVRTKHVHLELIDYLEGSVDAAARRRITEHLDTCKRCREEMETIAPAVSELKTMPEETVPQTYFAGFLPRVHESLQKKREKKPLWNPRAVYVTVPVLSFVVLFFLLLNVPVLERKPNLHETIRPLIVDLSPDDIAEVMGSRLHGEVLNETENPAVYNTMMRKQYNAAKVVKDALDDKSMSLSLNENDYQGVIESLNDDQVDHIIVRLKERTIL